MQPQPGIVPAWAALTIWGVVNVVNLLQAIGFLSRLRSGSMAVNHLLGYGMIALGVPAAAALIALVHARAGWPQWIGTAVYLAFITLMIGVDYAWPVEFRSPARAVILVPYLVLFFGSILLMGLPMYSQDRRLWLVTAATSALLLGAMGVAMRKGVG
jgi:hypothetical protein